MKIAVGIAGILLGSCVLSSCFRGSQDPGLDPVKSGSPAGTPVFEPQVEAVVQWQLTATRNGYGLDMIVNGRRHFVEHGGLYLHGKEVEVSVPGVPVGATSAFDLALPDGAGRLYYIVPESETQYAIYSRFADPAEGGQLQTARRVKGITL